MDCQCTLVRLNRSKYSTNVLILCQNQSLALHQKTSREYPTKMVGPMKAKVTGIADITNSEFWGQYSPIDIVQQISTANGQQVKGEIIEQSITPIHVMPTPQTQELTESSDGPYCPMQIFHKKSTIQTCTQSVDLPLWISHPWSSANESSKWCSAKWYESST